MAVRVRIRGAGDGRPGTLNMLRQVVVLAAMVAVALAARSYHGYKVYHLLPTEAQQTLLQKFEGQQGYDFWTRRRLPGMPVDIMVEPHLQDSFIVFLETHRIAYQVLINDVQMTIDAERMHQMTAVKSTNGRISFTKYYRYDEINSYLSELAASYPDLVSVQSIGNTFEGRAINIIKISSGGGGQRPVILIDAGIHAREWIAPAMALYIINQLVENGDNANLVSSVDWHIIPVLNPDGYEYTHTTDRMWRKTRSVSSPTCRGVDGNRNFDFHWLEFGEEGGPCSSLYAGSKGFSESETAALRDYALANAGNIKLYITLHSAASFFMYPWGYTSSLPSDWKIMDDLAQAANAAQVAAGGESYDIGSTMNAMYPVAGGSADWMKGVANVSLPYIVELPGGGTTGFDMPPSEIQKTVSQFYEAVRVFGNYIASNY